MSLRQVRDEGRTRPQQKIQPPIQTLRDRICLAAQKAAGNKRERAELFGIPLLNLANGHRASLVNSFSA